MATFEGAGRFLEIEGLDESRQERWQSLYPNPGIEAAAYSSDPAPGVLEDGFGRREVYTVLAPEESHLVEDHRNPAEQSYLLESD